MARNSFEGLHEYEDTPKVDPLSPPAIDLAVRYKDAPTTVVSMFDGATELEELTPIALKKLRQILDQPTDFDSVRMVQAQLSAATTVVNLQVKVDEGRLRRRKVDILPKLLELIASEENRMSQRALISGTIVDAEILS